VVAIHHRAGVAVFAGKREAFLFQVQQGAAITGVHRLSEEIVADAEVEGEARADLPVVLKECSEVDLALAPSRASVCLGERRESEQEIGEGRARARRIGTEGVKGAEGESSAAPRRLSYADGGRRHRS